MKVIIGSGKLATLLIDRIERSETVGVYGRNEETVQSLLKRYSHLQAVPIERLNEADDVFLCIPASSYHSFFKEASSIIKKDAILYHMATALMKNDVKELTQGQTIIPLKFAGHALQAKQEQGGILVLEKEWAEKYDQINFLFPLLQVVIGREEEVLMANTLATKAAIEMAMTVEHELKKKAISETIASQMLKQVVPGVLNSYLSGNLGHFARTFVNEVQKKVDDDQ
ncbi:NAD(P)-binding domain-containing protein [Bacillus sp. JCM 19034]|uniref:NAD(P)-binding domain-containing protein n=1 Tax=Bacillus sp. JCM 19034 TaxID=1481928 RepID=UPI00078252E4|nr:NAD(P)-binding domain-containing protein [Bacillus sp. JCM 19034]